MWIHRETADTVRQATAERPIVVLTGTRQAGKTSLLRSLYPDMAYVSLDLPMDAEEADQDGCAFLARHGRPLIIDEAQRAPGLLRYVKSEVDARRSEAGLYLLSGSQKLQLMAGISESLAGRARILELHTLSAWEIHSASGQGWDEAALLRWIWMGGYPELHGRALEPSHFYSDLVATYLERDVRQIVNVRSLRDFNRFMRLAAARTGQLVSANALAVDLGLSPNTVRSWLSVLAASNVVALLEPYYRNVGKRVVKSPKLYFLDTGLAAFLVGFRSPEDLRASGHLGAFFETHVVGQILRWHANRGLAADVYFYRDYHGAEVDIVVPVGERVHLFECKWTGSPPARVKGFEAVAAALGPDAVLSRTVITPVPGYRRLPRRGFAMDDSVALRSLEALFPPVVQRPRSGGPM